MSCTAYTQKKASQSALQVLPCPTASRSHTATSPLTCGTTSELTSSSKSSSEPSSPPQPKSSSPMLRAGLAPPLLLLLASPDALPYSRYCTRTPLLGAALASPAAAPAAAAPPPLLAGEAVAVGRLEGGASDSQSSLLSAEKPRAVPAGLTAQLPAAGLACGHGAMVSRLHTWSW